MNATGTISGLTSGQPLGLLHATVAKSQTNALGHLKASQYVCLFDDAINAFFPKTGLADERLLHGDGSPFLMDMHTCYLAELRAGDAVTIAAIHLEHDAKRARLIMTMAAETDGRLCATTELLLINMSVSQRKPLPWSPSQMSLWAELHQHHRSIVWPPQTGRAITTLVKP